MAFRGTPMATYSIEEAKARLSELIDKALASEGVMITRGGKPLVELKPTMSAAVRRPPSRATSGIAARAKTRPRLGEKAVDIIRRMRDDREEAILSAVAAASRGPMFSRYVGVDYSGAETPDQSLPGIRIFVAESDAVLPIEVAPPPGPGKYWSRRALAERLIEELGGGVPTLVGLHHAFSFPLRYFDKYRLDRNWTSFLDDFQRHWPTDDDHTYVDFVRDGAVGHGDLRKGNPKWRRLTEERAGRPRPRVRSSKALWRQYSGSKRNPRLLRSARPISRFDWNDGLQLFQKEVGFFKIVDHQSALAIAAPVAGDIITSKTSCTSAGAESRCRSPAAASCPPRSRRSCPRTIRRGCRPRRRACGWRCGRGRSGRG